MAAGRRCSPGGRQRPCCEPRAGRQRVGADAEASMAAATAAATILELDPSHERAGRVIEDIVRLEKRIFPKHESLARSFHDELKRRNSGLIYSASGDEVVGYAMYTCNTSLCATITKLAVKETCRRQGHGEALLAAAVERCRSRRFQRVSLHVDPARTAAVALYRRAGFQVDATVQDYYAPQRNAYRMYIDL
ncbi:hypothetical protein EJB05_19324, partial [Eragrostis curvula]